MASSVRAQESKERALFLCLSQQSFAWLVGASKLAQIRSWCPLILQSTPDEKSIPSLFLSRHPWRRISSRRYDPRRLVLASWVSALLFLMFYFSARGPWNHVMTNNAPNQLQEAY